MNYERPRPKILASLRRVGARVVIFAVAGAAFRLALPKISREATQSPPLAADVTAAMPPLDLAAAGEHETNDGNKFDGIGPPKSFEPMAAAQPVAANHTGADHADHAGLLPEEDRKTLRATLTPARREHSSSEEYQAVDDQPHCVADEGSLADAVAAGCGPISPPRCIDVGTDEDPGPLYAYLTSPSGHEKGCLVDPDVAQRFSCPTPLPPNAAHKFPGGKFERKNPQAPYCLFFPGSFF